MTLVYSLDRVRRLRMVLLVDVVAGVLLGILGIYVASVDADFRRLGTVVGVAGLLVAVMSVVSLRVLPDRDTRAKVAVAVTGVLTVLIGFGFARVILGFAMIVLGIAILVLALLRDDPELVP